MSVVLAGLGSELVGMIGKSLFDSLSKEHDKEKKAEEKNMFGIEALSKFVRGLKKGKYYQIDAEIKVTEGRGKVSNNPYWKMSFINKKGVEIGTGMCEEEHFCSYEAGMNRYRGMVKVAINGGFFSIEPCQGEQYK